jgi:lipopolysaccharide transport protein LptA
MTVYPPKKSLTPEQTPGQTPESPKNPTDQSSVPIVIESDTLKLDNPNQKATYTGNVVATKGLTEIRADEMIVYITKTPEAEDDVEKIEVFGNVRVVQESTTITGEKGVYLNKDQQAMIEGTAQKKARAEDKIQNMILEAPVIEAFLATKTIKAKGSTVESPGQGQRVHSVIGEGPIPTPTPKEPIKKKQSQTNKDDLPSVTLFPGKSQQGGQ